MQIIKQTIITIIICLAILTGVNLVYAWTGPTQSPPGGNVSAPINIGSSSQYKSGALGLGGLLQAPQIQLTTGAAAGRVLTSDASGLASWQTGGGASGVSQIIAGTNITISPASGTGVVTINSTGGGAGGYWALSGTNIYNTNTGGTVRWVNDSGGQVGFLGYNGSDALVGASGAVGGSLRLRAGDTDRVFIQASTGNVGIGTVSPLDKLHIDAGASGRPVVRFSGGGISNTWHIGRSTSYNIFTIAETNVGDWIAVQGGTGYVGIGTVSPAQKLDVSGYVKGTGLCIGSDCRTAWPGGGGATFQFYQSGNVGCGGSVNLGLRTFCFISRHEHNASCVVVRNADGTWIGSNPACGSEGGSAWQQCAFMCAY